MNEYDVKRLILAFSIQAEIEGMKAENADCIAQGHTGSHSEHHFYEKSEELRELASKHNDQL